MRLFSFFVSVLLCLTLVSCSGERKDAHDTLISLMESCAPLPTGVIYTHDAEEGEAGYLSPALAEALWGDDAEEGFSMLSDYAVYTSSFAAPYEIGVFCTYSATDARRIEELCLARADIVSVAVRQTEYHKLCRNVRIVREGRMVAFLLTDDPEGAVRAARRLIS